MFLSLFSTEKQLFLKAPFRALDMKDCALDSGDFLSV